MTAGFVLMLVGAAWYASARLADYVSSRRPEPSSVIRRVGRDSNRDYRRLLSKLGLGVTLTGAVIVVIALAAS